MAHRMYLGPRSSLYSNHTTRVASYQPGRFAMGARGSLILESGILASHGRSAVKSGPSDAPGDIAAAVLGGQSDHLHPRGDLAVGNRRAVRARPVGRTLMLRKPTLAPPVGLSPKPHSDARTRSASAGKICRAFSVGFCQRGGRANPPRHREKRQHSRGRPGPMMFFEFDNSRRPKLGFSDRNAPSVPSGDLGAWAGLHADLSRRKESPL